MVNNAICLVAIGYGIGACISFCRRFRFREGMAIFVLCAVVAAYCAPIVGKSMPTVESVYKWIYGPFSSFTLKQLGIKQED